MIQLLHRFGRREAQSAPTLATCEACGHSQQNHERGRDACARALCDCARYRWTAGAHVRAA